MDKERDSLRDENIELKNKIKELELKIKKLEKDILSESDDETTDDEVLDAFNKIKSGEASRMAQKG